MIKSCPNCANKMEKEGICCVFGGSVLEENEVEKDFNCDYFISVLELELNILENENININEMEGEIYDL